MSESLSDASLATNRTPLTQNPGLLFVLSGCLVGFNFPLAKMAAQAGINPLFWVALISFGACLTLLPLLLSQRQLHLPRGQSLRYALIAGPLTFTFPNLLVFMLVPKVGAGYSGMMFALSPVFTLAFAAGCGFQTPSRKGLLGIVLGLSGAGLITLGRQTEAASPALPYLLASAAIPALLAAGNVYRSIDWPQPTKPLQAEQLAFWSHGFAAVIYLLLLVIQGDFTSLPAQSHTPVFLQLLVAGATAPVVFRLQHYGGPVLLSQLGYIAAAVSLVCVNLWLGERYSLVTWAGAGVIALGIALSVSQPSAAQPLKTRKGTV